jgi:hypothetical protein
MTHDVIGNDGGTRRRWPMVVGAVVVTTAIVSLLLRQSHSPRPNDSALPTAQPAPSRAGSPSAGASSQAAARDAPLPDLVLVVGAKLDELTPDGDLRTLADLPAGATDVWATTLPVSPAPAPGADAGHVVHVFGVASGRAFREDVGPDGVRRTDLGAASAMLQTQEYPVLVYEGQPVAVGDPGGARVALPAGWRPGRFETLGFAGILIRPTGVPGDVEIASWGPGGTPQPLATDAKLLAVTDGGQAIWLAPSCPDGPRCVLYFGDIGGVHPSYGMQAPPGTRYVVAPAAYGSGSYVAAVAERAGPPADVAGAGLLVLVEPWQASATIVAGSDGVAASAGMFWPDGRHLVFAAHTAGGLHLQRYDIDTGRSRAFGPVLPEAAHLLTAFGSVGGVTVQP